MRVFSQLYIFSIFDALWEIEMIWKKEDHFKWNYDSINHFQHFMNDALWLLTKI